MALNTITNRKKITAIVFVFLLFSPLILCFTSENVKAGYVDEDTDIDSHITWITLYDKTGSVIVNWTSVNGDLSPNVNSQNTQVGYWSVGILINETESAYFTYAYEALSLFYLKFENLTDSYSWYINQINIESYLSSYHDYGTYTVINFKTPDWSEQMTYDWLFLDDALTVNATLDINHGTVTTYSSSYEPYHYPNVTNNTVRWVRAVNSSLAGARTLYNYNSVNVQSVYYALSGGNYYIYRQYAWVENIFALTGADNLSLGWVPFNTDGDSSSIACIIYSSSVSDYTWSDDYWNLANFVQTPLAIIYPDELTTERKVIIPYSESYGNYILVAFVVSADLEGLGVTTGSDYATITDMQEFYVQARVDDISTVMTFTGTIINHETFVMDNNSIVYILLAFLPAIALGYMVGRVGVIAGLAIMGLLLGFTITNYFWVMAITLGFCGVLLYTGGVDTNE